MNRDVSLAVNDFRDDLHSAIVLRQQFFARELDRAFIRDGGRILYALDSSILKYFFSGEEKSPKVQKKHKPGGAAAKERYQIFMGPRSDPPLRVRCEAGEKRLGWIASRYLLEGMGDANAAPLLILPGHDIEVGSLFALIAKNFADLPVKVSAALAMAQQAEEIEARVKSGAAQPEVYKDVVEGLFEILYRIQEPHEQFHLFNRFARERRFLSLNAAANIETFQAPEFRVNGHHVFTNLSALEGRVRGGVDAQGFAQWWDRDLNDALPKRFSGNDRYALNALDVLNKALRPRQIRVVLFTLNEIIIDKGSFYLPFAYNGDEHEMLQKASFADLYLRHPRALLADPELSRPTAEDGNEASLELSGSLDSLLNVVFEQWERIRKNLGDAPRRLDLFGTWLAFTQSLWLRENKNSSALSDGSLEKVLRGKPGAHRDFIQSWADYVEKLSSSHAAGATDTAKHEIAEILSERGEIAGAIGRIRGWVNKLTEESWSDFFITAAGTGLELIKVTGGRSPPLVWPMPQLVVRGEGAWREMLTDLWSTDDVKQRADHLMARASALGGGPLNGYVRALAYGVIFACVSRWHITRLLAQRAVQIVTEIDPAHPPVDPSLTTEVIDGREAFYLAAIGARIAGDYAEARLLLGRAEDCLKREKPGANEVHKITGLRFAIERREIDAAELNAQVEGAVSAARRSALLPKAQEQAEALLALVKVPLQQEDGCLEKDIRRQASLARRSLFIQSLAHLAELENNTVQKVAKQRNLLGDLKSIVLEQAREIEETYKDLRWLPLRDRVLLQVGADAAKVWNDLDLELQRPYKEIGTLVNSGVFKFAAAEGQFLRRMERLAEIMTAPA